MIEFLKRINDLNIKLAKFDKDALDQLYLRVFNSADGEMVLQDLANRCHVYDTTNLGGDGQFNSNAEGMRAMWLSIQSRLQGAVMVKKTEE